MATPGHTRFRLIMNVLVMYDRQTDSLWSQLLGQAAEGPLAGTQLKRVKSTSLFSFG